MAARNAIALSAPEFERRLRALLSEIDAEDNHGCVQCVQCSGCSACTFCRDGERLVRCHYCVRCALCSDSSHCKGSRNLIHCSHCNESENCVDSSYLVRCVALTGCSYCFGCVGLSQADFHILNQPYERSEYFAITAQLLRELRLEP
jgi:hypothetical protein